MQEVFPEQIQTRKRNLAFSRIKRRILKHLWLVRAGIVASAFLGVYLIVVLLGFIFGRTPVGLYAGLFRDFLFTPQGKIESISGRTNILILGKGGAGHDAPDLTDTIIFASVSHENPKVTLISLPRDIWIPALRAKLNSTYYWGNQRQEGGGLILAKSTVEEIVGQPVHYGVVVDFSGFVRIVDILGGIKVDVERGFVDKKYPIPGREDDECGGDDPEFLCRYETIQFEKGSRLMDGETALKFVRSRNAEGDEGTDLARAARQQKVLVAMRQKVLSPKIILSPKKTLAIVRTVRESVETDIKRSQVAILARRVLQSDGQETYILPEEFLERPPKSARYDNLYVFIPKADDWSEVHKWVENVLLNN